MVKIVGHRGFRFEEPENTLRSFKAAIRCGVNAVEFDLRLTKDKKIVIFHDEAVDKKTNGNGKVSNLELKELKKLDVIKNSKKDKILEFEEALKFFKNKKIELVIELKETGFEKKVLNLLEKYKLKERSIIISFLKEALKQVRRYDKKVRTGIIYVIHHQPIKLALSLNANFIVPLAVFLFKPAIEKAHKNNLKILVWVLNKPEAIKKFISYGVDYIATDNPKLARFAVKD